MSKNRLKDMNHHNSMNRLKYVQIYSPAQKITIIKNWAETKSWFDKSFVLNIEGHYELYGDVTTKQVQALDNIISKYHIRCENYLQGVQSPEIFYIPRRCVL